MSDPKTNSKTPVAPTDLAASLDLLRSRISKIPKPLEKEIDRAAKVLREGKVEEAAALFSRVERKFNLIQNVLGMRQFTSAVVIPSAPEAPVARKPWYRRLLTLGSALVLVTAVTGCGTISKFHTVKELQRVEDAKTDLAKNERDRLERGRDYSYGVGEALDKICEEQATPEVKVAKVLNERAMLTLGSPDSETALQLKQMVDDLLSANEDLRKRGERQLAVRDAAIAKLEKKALALEKTLGKAEEARDKEFISDANKAAAWDEENSFINSINPFRDFWKFIKKLFFLLLIVGLLGVILKVAAMFFPALMPLSKLVDVVLGGFGKLIFRAAPAAQRTAGVVSAEAHALSEKTLAGLVAAVQDLRYDHGDDMKKKVEEALDYRDLTNPALANKVTQVKQTLRAAGEDV